MRVVGRGERGHGGPAVIAPGVRGVGREVVVRGEEGRGVRVVVVRRGEVVWGGRRHPRGS